MADSRTRYYGGEWRERKGAALSQPTRKSNGSYHNMPHLPLQSEWSESEDDELSQAWRNNAIGMLIEEMLSVLTPMQRTCLETYAYDFGRVDNTADRKQGVDSGIRKMARTIINKRTGKPYNQTSVRSALDKAFVKIQNHVDSMEPWKKATLARSIGAENAKYAGLTMYLPTPEGLSDEQS